MKKNQILTVILITSILASCNMMDARYHRSQVAAEGEEFTLGTIQSKVKKGMSQAEVAEALGSPNMVNTDENSNEVWVYDKVSTETAISGSGAFGSTIFTSRDYSAGAYSSTQKTTTAIIKFDSLKKVREISYRSSKF